MWREICTLRYYEQLHTLRSDTVTHTEFQCYSFRYCDRLLKTGGDKLSEVQLEEHLSKIVALFSYINDKDLFSEIYRNLLAKRLLNARSASDDAEKSMVTKLKHKCGAQFTGKRWERWEG